ncbi:MAG: galactose-1-phosphate uridylyltransferase [Candidatus Omnitrophica bacterium]|nr:galactose-1-phosphate uridylyltransferase [Candidatus Omnitrophota bacterium]
MSELRRDPIADRWVVVKTKEDSLAPQDYLQEDHSSHQAAICQFCEGRENQTPQEVDVIRAEGTSANTPGWMTRVVPNKFPALTIEGDIGKRGIGLYDISNGIGAHEVLIETPEHGKNFAEYSVEEISNVLRLYQRRALSLAKDKRFKYIMIFKNYGESAGASVEHEHSQIIALPMVPRYVIDELEGAKAYFQYRGRCVYCDMIQQEYEDKNRIVTENEHFIAFCPYVPRYTFESWIFPKEHESVFYSLQDEERLALAQILKDMLSRLKTCLADPSYNFYLHIAPLNHGNQESYHWHIEIVPQLTREAGFEWGTGFYVIHTSPDVAAEYLRGEGKG